MACYRAFNVFMRSRNKLRANDSSAQDCRTVPVQFYSSDCKKENKGLVLGMYCTEGKGDALKLTPSAQDFDDKIEGKIAALIKKFKVTGKVGKGKVFNNVGNCDFKSIAVVGLGDEGASYNELEVIDEGMENVRVAAGVGARALQDQCCTEVHLDPMEYPEQAAEGAGLAVWRYNLNKQKQSRKTIPKLELHNPGDIDAWTRGLFKAESQNLARRLTDAPANQITPAIFAQSTIDALCPCGVNVEVRTLEWIDKVRLNSFLVIAKGTCEPPVVLEIAYCGTDPEDKPIAIVGSGITFDSGGLSLREKNGISKYRGSMSGAAVAVGAIRAAAALSLPININAVLPLCESMLSSLTCKPGDVVTLLNGKTLGVRDISKAATVIMMDTLIYAQQTYKPKVLIDLGCMAHGVVKGLGGSATGLFTNSKFLAKEFEKAGAISGDRVWRLPLWKYFKRLVTDNKTYDIGNNGCGPASSCLAAAVLHQAVPCIDWAHLDIHGTGMITKHNTLPYLLKNNMSGRPTRTLIQLLTQLACPKSK